MLRQYRFIAHLHLQTHMPTSSLSSYLAASAKSAVTLFRQIVTLGNLADIVLMFTGLGIVPTYENPLVAYDRIVPNPKPSQLSQSPLMPGHLGQTLVSDMTCYCRPDVVGSLDSRASRSNCLFCFYGSDPIVIKRYLSLQKIKMPEFKNTASLNGL